MNGAFFIDKEINCTSRDVVNEIVKKCETSKVGHTGTLDPLATGVLVVCVGKATKLVNMLTCEHKTYEAEITLGIKTDTYDITGNILKEEIPNLTDEEIINVVNNFKGEYEQEVPIYSAVKINGKKLYEYAREGKEVELPKRLVSIDDIKIISDIKRENNRIIFSIETSVSKGTYIRSLVNDIASKLNTIGVMSSLRRTKLGDISINECKSIDDLSFSDLVSVKELLKRYDIVKVTDELKKDILNGKIIENIYNKNLIVFCDSEDKVLAIYKKYEKDETKIKPEIVLGGI
jgi:tRNA pseudouridine55 synthase